MDDAYTASSLQGCSCNQQLKDAAQQQGFSNNAVAVSKSLCFASDTSLDWCLRYQALISLLCELAGYRIPLPLGSLVKYHCSKLLQELQLWKTALYMTLASRHCC